MYKLHFPIFVKTADKQQAFKMTWKRSNEFAEFCVSIQKQFSKISWKYDDDPIKIRKLIGIHEAFKNLGPEFSVDTEKKELIQFLKSNKPKWSKEKESITSI